MKEEEGKHINSKKTMFSLVSLAVLPFSVIFGVFWCLKCIFCVFRCVVVCFECLFGVFWVYISCYKCVLGEVKVFKSGLGCFMCFECYGVFWCVW